MNLQVKVQHLDNGPSFPPLSLSLPNSSKLIDLRKAIHKEWKLHPKQQLLSYRADPLEDDNKLIVAYEIMPEDPVMLELITATISVVITCPNGEKATVDNLDLNVPVESIREQASKGLGDGNLKKHLRLYFGNAEVTWKSPFRAILGLVDGSEFSTGICLHVVIPPGNRIKCAKVDLNWNVKTLKDNIRGLPAHQRNVLTLTFKGLDLTSSMVLMNIPNLDDDDVFESRLNEKGGSLA